MKFKAGVIIGITTIVALIIYLVLSSSTSYYIQISENENWVIDQGILKTSLLKTEYSHGGIYYMGDETIEYDTISTNVYFKAVDGSNNIFEIDGGRLTVSEVKSLIEGEWLGSSGTHGLNGFSQDQYDLGTVYLDIVYAVGGDSYSESLMFDVSVNEEGDNQLAPAFASVSKPFVLSKGGNTSNSLFYIGQSYDEVIELCESEHLFNKSANLTSGDSDGYPPDVGDISVTVGNKHGIGMFFNSEKICYMIYIREELPTDFEVQIGDQLKDIEGSFGDKYIVLGSSKEGMTIEYDMGTYYVIFQLDNKGIFGIQLNGVSYEHYLDSEE